MPRKSPPKADQLPALPPPDPKQLAQVVAWIIDGQTEQHVREAIAATMPGADAVILIRGAAGELAKAAAFDRDIVRGWCFEAYRELYRKALELADIPAALRAIKCIESMAEKQQLEEPTEDVSGDQGSAQPKG